LAQPPGEGTASIQSAIEPTLAAGTWVVDVAGGPGNWRIQLLGGDEAGVAGAVYTFLERLGYVFEMNGPVAPVALRWDLLKAGREVTVPAVRYRGIRQHINFAMDVSSYPIEEAKAYIRDLARMRFNHITFHSYTGQWFEVAVSDRKVLAGGFFYGVTNPVPHDPEISKFIRNKSVYCIPDIEPYMAKPEARSRLAMAWLRELMAEAKRVGLHIQFSFEPSTFRNREDALLACDAILATYPDIDRLELITRETGGWGAAAPEDIIRQAARDAFGEAVAISRELKDCIQECPRDLASYLTDLGRVIDTVKALPAHRAGRKMPDLSCGIYCAVPALLRLSLHLMRQEVPASVEFAILASHGSRGVAHNLREAGMTQADWNRSMLYSWIEFDGLMFYQQNPVRGIRQLLEDTEDAAGLPSIRGMAFNHWRTSENIVCARYAAEGTLVGAIPERTFYRQHAERLGVGRTDLYAAAMMEIDDADGRATMELPNSGFCAAWGGDRIGTLRWQLFDNAQRIEEQYDNARLLLGYCLAQTPGESGKAHLGLLDNRLRCTVQYLKALKRAAGLTPLCFEREPASLSEAEHRQVDAICNEALVSLDRYLRIFVASIPDRGAEGLLVSFCMNFPDHLKRIRKRYGTAWSAPEQPVVVSETSDQEGPPLPIVG
jgi:hypothetical protein